MDFTNAKHRDAFEQLKHHFNDTSEYPLDSQSSTAAMDMWLHKCLVARKWNVEKSTKMCAELFKWRREEPPFVDRMRLVPIPGGLVKGYSLPILQRLHPSHRELPEHKDEADKQNAFIEHVVREGGYPGAWHKWDKEGRPCYIERTGYIHPKKFLNVVHNHAASVGWSNRDATHLTHLYCNEMGSLLCKYQSTVLGRPINEAHLVLDLKHLHWSQLHGPAMDMLKDMSDLDKKYYPEGLGRLSLVNCPGIFSIFWVIVKVWIPAQTKAKIHMVDPGKTPAYMEKWFDKQDLPEFLGGTCRCSAESGECIPLPHAKHHES
eukprot:PhM_4_TR3777/c0_g3_i1/m.8433